MKELKIPGCFVRRNQKIKDNRGSFFKIFNISFLPKNWNKFHIKEIYITKSKKNVLRGMHFQIPPFDHNKIVICNRGCVTDVLLDLRKGKNYGKALSIDLNSKNYNVLYIAKGVAHGFCTNSKGATLTYLVNSIYSPKHDKGIKWNSFNFKWPIKNPLLSKRDQGFQELKDFKVPEEWLT